MATDQEQKRKQDKKPSDTEAIAIIAGVLVVGASAQATANTLEPKIGILAKFLLPALILALAKPLPVPSSNATSAEQAAVNLEPMFRAAYVLNAAKRLEAGGSVEAEKTYFNQHLAAAQNRVLAARDVDKATRKYGTKLGWYAMMDAKTSTECGKANGKNFDATRRPPIGYPGSVHPECRCKAGKPFNTSASVYNIEPEKRAA